MTLTTAGFTSYDRRAPEMPYTIVKDGDRICVHKKKADGSAGERIACHDTQAEAQSHMAALYANVSDADKSMTGILATFGGEVKALGEGKVGGYLVRFGSPEQPDNSSFRDFFTLKTDFGTDFPARTAVYYNHGLDDTLGRRRLADGASLKADEVGIWVEAQLKLRDEWERAVYSLAQAGKLSWSSGTAHHLVERAAVKSGDKIIAHEITVWPLGLDASLTPTPAEPRCAAVALKSTDSLSLKELMDAPCAECQVKSLARRTEKWLDDGADLLMGHLQIAEAEMKRGQMQFSAARRERMARIAAFLQDGNWLEAREEMNHLLAETGPRDEPTVTGETEALGMSAASVTPAAESTPAPIEVPRVDIGDLYSQLVRQEGLGWLQGVGM